MFYVNISKWQVREGLHSPSLPPTPSPARSSGTKEPVTKRGPAEVSRAGSRIEQHGALARSQREAAVRPGLQLIRL